METRSKAKNQSTYRIILQRRCTRKRRRAESPSILSRLGSRTAIVLSPAIIAICTGAILKAEIAVYTIITGVAGHGVGSSSEAWSHRQHRFRWTSGLT